MKQILIIMIALMIADFIKFIVKKTITKFDDYKKFRLIGRKIVITKCSVDKAWYEDYIGEVFTIKNVLPTGEYVIGERYNLNGNLVFQKDCKIIENKE